MSETSLPSWARVGAKVVCIDNCWSPGTFIAECDRKLCVGAKYTIRDTLIWKGAPCIRLEEIRRTVYPDIGIEVPYFLSRFRPLVSDSDELGIETQLYRAKGRKSKAPARQPEPTA